MDLSERKRRILRALAEEHIKTNEPVSSKDIAERYLNNISSATIRNELASMEEQGVIAKTHISSGRVPTALGYQMFIEELLPSVRPTAKELDKIKANVAQRVNGFGSLAEQTAEALAEVCGLPSVVLSGVGPNAVVESIKIFKITKEQCLVVVVTNEGIIKDLVLDTEDISSTSCEDASVFLSKTFGGQPLFKINPKSVSNELLRFKSAVAMLVAVVERNASRGEVATSGQGKLFDKFEDPSKAKGLYNLLDNKERLKEIVTASENGVSVQVRSVDGTECAVVSATIKAKNQPISVAVMGPARMDYQKVIKTIKGLSKIWEE